jgi:excisionase family DNA binding protein
MKDDFCILRDLKVEILDVKLLAKLLNRCPMTIYRWMKQNDPIPYHKVRGRFLFFKDDVLKWIQNQ